MGRESVSYRVTRRDNLHGRKGDPAGKRCLEREGLSRENRGEASFGNKTQQGFERKKTVLLGRPRPVPGRSLSG